MMDDILELRGLRFSYPDASRPALDGIDLRLRAGDFCVVCGASGSGKSTLLRLIKPQLSPVGERQGSIIFLGTDPAAMDARESAAALGFVMQRPQDQLVMDSVWHEMAFGLENLGLDQEDMHRRVAETAHYLGMSPWVTQRVATLSGGQQRIVNLASVLVMRPKLLLLDEPISMLDPIAAVDFIALLARVNQELGITVLVAEHRLDLLLPHANRVLLLQEGKAAYSGDVQGFLRHCLSEGSRVDAALPPAARLCTGDESSIPVTISQGRTWLADVTSTAGLSGWGPSLEDRSAKTPTPAPDIEAHVSASVPSSEGPFAESPDGEAAPLIEARELWFRYGPQEPFVLRGASFAARAGKVHAIVGGNGSGKSTLLFALAGVNKPQRGSVRRVGKLHVAALAQDPRVLFVCDTLRDDLRERSDRFAYDDSDIARVMQRLDLPESLLDSHPFDLAGGELQRAALAKLLLAKPQVLLLDEPSKGLDAQAKSDLVGLLHELAQEGSAVVLVSHDLDFVAEAAHTVSMIFDGVVDTCSPVQDFFAGNLFYTCAVGRLSQGIIEPCVTFEQLRERLEAMR